MNLSCPAAHSHNTAPSGCDIMIVMNDLHQTWGGQKRETVTKTTDSDREQQIQQTYSTENCWDGVQYPFLPEGEYFSQSHI